MGERGWIDFQTLGPWPPAQEPGCAPVTKSLAHLPQWLRFYLSLGSNYILIRLHSLKRYQIHQLLNTRQFPLQFDVLTSFSPSLIDRCLRWSREIITVGHKGWKFWPNFYWVETPILKRVTLTSCNNTKKKERALEFRDLAIDQKQVARFSVTEFVKIKNGIGWCDLHSSLLLSPSLSWTTSRPLRKFSSSLRWLRSLDATADDEYAYRIPHPILNLSTPR